MVNVTTAATRTGLVDLARPEPGTISLEAIAHGLGHINRWNGALELPISVAQHSLLVAEIFTRLRPDLRRFAIYALLHDAHEYLLGDWAAPSFADYMNRAAQELADFFLTREGAPVPSQVERSLLNARRQQQEAIDAEIYDALGVRRPWQLAFADNELLRTISQSDIYARTVEWRALMPAENGLSPYPSPPFALPRLKPLPALVAAEKFTEAVQRELAALRDAGVAA